MLSISPSIIKKFEHARLRDLESRLYPWLCSEVAGFAALDPMMARDELHLLLKEAEQADLDVETDFALFAYLLLQDGVNWRTVLAQRNVQDALTIEGVTPSSRLKWLEGWLNSQGHNAAATSQGA